MKKLEIIIKPEKLENLKSILDDCKASGVMISNIMAMETSGGIHRCTAVQNMRSIFFQRSK